MLRKTVNERVGQFVLPGQTVGVVEEFNPGIGTFEVNGSIYSKIIGTIVIDMYTRTISVARRGKGPIFPIRGNIVEGQVTAVLQNKIVFVNIYKVGKIYLNRPFTGIIYISRVSREYIKNLLKYVKPGDLVKANVISIKNGAFQLSLIGEKLGVIRGYCSQCGQTLVRRGKKLYCPTCNRYEERKIAVDYGEV